MVSLNPPRRTGCDSIESIAATVGDRTPEALRYGVRISETSSGCVSMAVVFAPDTGAPMHTWVVGSGESH